MSGVGSDLLVNGKFYLNRVTQRETQPVLQGDAAERGTSRLVEATVLTTRPIPAESVPIVNTPNRYRVR